ncbi:MAG: translation initiation factor IF-2 subunit beta [Candidatus Aenigmarchaeota archaeon]|nr:translation initiation factor IF-2 subunit beta [Candidatus Aenigmarchaeota archaeon]
MNYEEMLEKAMKELPAEIKTKQRFEIPQVICEVVGNKTILRNFLEILANLRRDAKHLSKFLLKELATSGNVEDDVLIFQGKISKEIIQKKIEDYVKRFVICKECKNPDTKLLKEDRITVMKCEACGARSAVENI